MCCLQPRWDYDLYTKPLVLQKVESIDHMKISKRVQLYLLGSRLLGWLSRAPKPFSKFVWRAQSLWQAIWLGLLDAEGLNEITRFYYMDTSEFEEEEFNIRQGLWPWETKAIRNYLKGRKRVLVAGAGRGREVIALARLGYKVTAFDSSSYLTAACRRNLQKAGCTAQVLDASPDQFPKRLDLYDALLIGRGCYHHIPGRRRRVEFLKEGRFWLNSGAPILLSDFFTRPVDSRFYLRTQAIANFIRRLRNSRERVELGDWLTDCMQHAFTRKEIEKEFSEVGILLEDFAVSPFSAESRLAHAVGRVL
jgi:SAM-dependent methyltransferase